jgi:hypothetical protein
LFGPESQLDTAYDQEYVSSMRIVEAKPIDRFHVFLRFDDGQAGAVDLGHLAGRGVFAAWLEKGVFEQLFITPEGAIAWPGELDLCPDSLYMQLVGKSVAEVFPAAIDSPAHARS